MVQIARAEMDFLHDHIAGSGYALLLADAKGVILCKKIGPPLKKMFAHAGMTLAQNGANDALIRCRASSWRP